MKENLKCSFVVPGYKCDTYIERNIESILEQDYRNYEIIIVLNNEWETRKDLYASLKEKYGDKIQLHWLPQGGLGNANNFGFEKSTGDIISHLSSDLYLSPGTLRTWVEAFNDNPDCDLVYSGYRFTGNDPTNIYYSNDFDRYHLECENFIDGANPYRRKIFKPWDTELKSLIDWDFMLSITAGGCKTHYIKEPLYWAELPVEGGLSDDSNRNWVRRRKQIRDKHNIPDRKICIASLVPKLALELAKLCDFDFRLYPGHKPHEYLVVYAYGFPCNEEMIQASTGIFFQHYGQKIVHWIGNDIKTLIQNRWYDVDYYTQMVLNKIQIHYCLNKPDQDILKRLGIEAEVVYPPILIPEITEKVNAVSVNEDEVMAQLKKAMPDIEFRKNDLSCDITIHFDDNITSTLQSVCLGNHVISNMYLPSTHYIQGFTNIPELRKMLVHTIRQLRRGISGDSQEAINFYKEKVNPTYFKRKIEKIAERKVSKYAKLEELQQLS